MASISEKRQQLLARSRSGFDIESFEEDIRQFIEAHRAPQVQDGGAEMPSHPVEQALGTVTAPLRWFFDETKPGQFLRGISEGAAKALIGEKEYMGQVTTGSETADKIAQTIGQFAAPIVVMSQLGGPIGQATAQTVASSPALQNINPNVISALRSAGTGVASLAAQEALRPELELDWKDYAGRAAFMGAAGLASPAIMPKVFQAAPGIHPLAEAAISSAAGGFAGSLASLPFAWDDLEGEGLEKIAPALKKVGLDAATYAVFGTLMAALNPQTWGDRSPQARDAAIKAMNAYNKRAEALRAGNTAEAERYGQEFEKWGHTFFHYARQVMQQSSKHEGSFKTAQELVKLFEGADPRSITPQQFGKFIEVALTRQQPTITAEGDQLVPVQVQASQTTPSAQSGVVPVAPPPAEPAAEPEPAQPIGASSPVLERAEDVPFNVATGRIEEAPLTVRALEFVSAMREFQKAGDTLNYPLLLGRVYNAGKEYEEYARRFYEKTGKPLAEHPEAQQIEQAFAQLGLSRTDFGEMLSAYRMLKSEVEAQQQEPQFISVSGFRNSGLVRINPERIKPGDTVFDPRGKEFTVDEVDREKGILRVTDTNGTKTALGINIARIPASLAATQEEISPPVIGLPSETEAPLKTQPSESQTEISDIEQETPATEPTIPSREQLLTESEEARNINPNAPTIIRYLLDQDIGRVIKSVESGQITKHSALELYNWAAQALGLSKEAQEVHRGRIEAAKEPVRMERQEIEPTGNVSVAYTPTKQIKVETKFEVVPLESVLSSEQEGYPEYLQPRKAVSREERWELINRLRRQLNPELLEHSANAADGAPIVNKRLEVETGNGRILALREMAAENNENYLKYKGWLVQNAERLGLNPEKIQQIENPVLVRVRTNEVPDVREFVEDANNPSVTVMSAAEQASVDARNMTQGLMNLFVPNEDGVIDTAANKEFVRTFFSTVVPSTERSKYFTDGKLNSDGYKRIQGAILAKAFGENYKLLTSILESQNASVKKVFNGFLASAADLSRIKDGIDQGIYHDLDITYELAEAANKLSSLKAEGQTVENYLNQIQLPGMDDLGSLSRLLLQKLNELGGGRSGSQKKVAAFLKNYALLVEEAGHPAQVQLPGLETEVPSREVLIEAASSPKALGIAEDQLSLGFEKGGVRFEEGELAEGRPEGSQEVGEQTDPQVAQGESPSEQEGARPITDEAGYRAIVSKHTLGTAARVAAQRNALNTFGSFLDTIRALDAELPEFAATVAKEAQLLFSDAQEQSSLYGQDPNVIETILFNYKTAALAAKQAGLEITPAEALEAAKGQEQLGLAEKVLNMNLQLFGGKKNDEWERILNPFFGQSEAGEGGPAQDDVVEGTPEGIQQTEEGRTPEESSPTLAEEAAASAAKLAPIEPQVVITPEQAPPGLKGRELDEWMKAAREARLVTRDTWDGNFKAVSRADVIKEAVESIRQAHGFADHILKQLKEMDTAVEAKNPNLLKRFLDYDSLNAELLAEMLQGQENEGPLHKYLFGDIDRGVNLKYSVERQLKEGLASVVQGIAPKDLKRWSKWFVKRPSQAYIIPIKLSDGRTLKLTKDERMDFYAHAQCAEWNLENLLNGGFVFFNNQGAVHKLSPADLERILATVTPKEKEIVDRVVLEVIRPIVEKYGDPVAEVLWGTKLTWFDWYYPISHPETTTPHSEDILAEFTRSLENMSFTHSRTAKDKPIVIKGFFRTVLTFADQFSDFAGLAIPVHNALAIVKDNDFINQMYLSGREAELEVWERFLRDVAGSFTKKTEFEKLYDKILRNISFSYIAGNISTILKQPVSLVVAATEIDFGPNIVKAMAQHKKGLQEAIEKSPKAWKRAQGYYSPESAMLSDAHEILEVFLGDKRWSVLLTKPSEKTDLFAIGTIWNLTKDHVQRHYPGLEGKAFDDKVIETFDRVIRRTQSSAEIHTKSALGRDMQSGLQWLLLFTNERNKHYNVVRRAFWRYERSQKTWADAVELLKTLFIVGIVQSGLLVAAEKVRDWVVGKKPEVDAGEVILSIIENALGLFYFGSEIFNTIRSTIEKGAFRGYELEGPVEGAFNKAVRGIVGVINTIEELRNNETYASGYKKDQPKWDTTLRRAVNDILSVVAAVSGVPYDTGRRYARGLLYHLGGEKAAFEFDARTRNPQPSYYYEQLWEALEKGNDKKAEEAMWVLRWKFKVNPQTGIVASAKRRGVSQAVLSKALRLYSQSKK